MYACFALETLSRRHSIRLAVRIKSASVMKASFSTNERYTLSSFIMTIYISFRSSLVYCSIKFFLLHETMSLFSNFLIEVDTVEPLYNYPLFSGNPLFNRPRLKVPKYFSVILYFPPVYALFRGRGNPGRLRQPLDG